MKRALSILFLLLSVGYAAYAQDADSLTISTFPHHQYSEVSALSAETLSRHDSIRLYRKPDAMRAVWMGAIIPGYGQIYNRSYWKLPIVYGAFFGCAYAITWTNGQYTDYQAAYRDLYTDIHDGVVTEDPSKTYIAILPEGYNLAAVGDAGKWVITLENRKNTFRRYRDLSIVASVLVYALSLIDAYVDAQLFDFDISDDLSVTLQPAINYDFMNQPTGEMKFAVKF